MYAYVIQAGELDSLRLPEVAILLYEAWERSRGPDYPPAQWDFYEDFLSNYFPREYLEALRYHLINVKHGTISVKHYSHKFNSVTIYEPDIIHRMRSRIHCYVDGLAYHFITDCRVQFL